MHGQAQKKNTSTLFWALAVFFFLPSLHSFAADQTATVLNLNGEKIQPLLLSDGDARKATLLIFTTIDCPIANSYAPELGRIQKEFDPEGIRIFLVHVDPAVNAEAAKKHATEYHLDMSVVLDLKHELATYAGATITPEAAIFDRAGMLLYRGRIDNRYEGYGKDRVKATTHELRMALDNVIHGEKIENPRTKAVGCRIEYLLPNKSVSNEPSKEKKL